MLAEGASFNTLKRQLQTTAPTIVRWKQRFGATGYYLALGGDEVRRGLVVGDALFDLGDELRTVALDHLPDAGSELVEKINPGIAANRRTKSLERG